MRGAGPLHYKVVELSTVDEGSLERTLNEWVSKGWNLDGVQFAMRESSKRPAMAFVFFTREGSPAELAEREPESREDRGAGARETLRRLSDAASTSAHGAPEARPVPAVSPYERLRQLAGEGEEEESLHGDEPRLPSGLRELDPNVDPDVDPDGESGP